MDEWRCVCTNPEHKHLNDHCPKPATADDGCCQACHDRIAEGREGSSQMSTPLRPFHDSKAPAPAWARTVAECRLRWLTSRHPKMNSLKRYGWAVRGSSEITRG